MRHTAGARLCPQDQPQRLRISRDVGLNSTPLSVPTALRLVLRTQPRSIDFESKKLAEELLHDLQPFSVVESGSAVARAVNDLELNWSIHLFIGATEFVRLVDGHLRILIAMQKEERRDAVIHMIHRTR